MMVEGDKRGLMGRGDLVRAIVALEGRREVGDEALAITGALMGFGVRAPEPTPAVLPQPTVSRGGEVGESSSAKIASGVVFWQPRSFVWHDPQSRRELAQALDVDEDDAVAEEEAERAAIAEVPPPKAPLLSTDRRLMPMLERALTAELFDDEIDVAELVRRWSDGEHVREVPRMHRRSWPSLLVLVDRDYSLVPFWRDQEVLVERLRQIVGVSGLVLRIVDERGPEGVLDGDGSLAGLPVLALTDLGWYRGASHRRAWLRLGRRLRRAGERIHALVPVPQSRWTAALARTWSAIAWERPVGGAVELDEGERTRRAKRLLGLAACAHRLEPGLLRALRRLLPHAEADVGTEADVWLHEEMGDSFPTATVVRAEHAATRRAGLGEESDSLRLAVRDTLRSWHWQRALGPEVWHSEALAIEGVVSDLIEPEQLGQAEKFAARLGGPARSGGAGHDERGGPEGVRSWLHYIGARVPMAVFNPTTLAGQGLQLAWWKTRIKGDPPPPNADPRLREQVFGISNAVEARTDLRQVGSELRAGEGRKGRGSPVVAISAAEQVAYAVDGIASRPSLSLVSDVGIDGRPSMVLELRTDRSTVWLEPLTKPEWASAIGRDRFGLWVEVEVKGVAFRMRWIPPGRFVVGSPEGEPERFEREGPMHDVTISRGFWLGETQVTQPLWQAVLGDRRSHFEDPERPVEGVSWDECQGKLIAALNESIGEERGESFRLPTEAEWEYACRAGTQTATYAGPSEVAVLDAIAWYGPNSEAGTRRVRQKKPNPWGLYDMLGNVWEWCLDGQRPYSSSVEGPDPVGPMQGGYRVYRGGSWSSAAFLVRAAYRRANPLGERHRNLGLRLVRGQRVRMDQGPEGQ